MKTKIENFINNLDKERIFYFGVLILFIFILIKLIVSFNYNIEQIIGMIVPFIYFLLCFLYVTTYRFQRVPTRIFLGLFIFIGTILKTRDFIEGSYILNEYTFYHIISGIIIIMILNGYQFHKSKRYSTRVYYLKNLFKVNEIKKCDEIIKRYHRIKKTNNDA